MPVRVHPFALWRSARRKLRCFAGGNPVKKALRAAFPRTVPILLGYVFVGMAFGLLFVSNGYPFYWAVLMSLLIYAGSMQFVALNFFIAPFGLMEIALITLLVNARHIFYGLTFVDKYKRMKRWRGYLIFALTDETYSLLCARPVPQGVDEKRYFFCVSALDQSYWVAGTLIGSFVGSRIPFDTAGMEFAMTALFIVIFIEQWLSSKSHIAALIGIACPLAALPFFGRDNLVLPAMLLMTLSLIALRAPIEKGLSPECAGKAAAKADGGEPG